MSEPATLRDRILAILAGYDPVALLTQPESDAEMGYGAEAEDLTYLLAGGGLDAEQCAGVLWAVFTQRYGDDAGPPGRYLAPGADCAAAAREAPEVGLDSEAEDEDVFDDGPGDPVVTAVLGILDDHDPAETEERQGAEDDEGFPVSDRCYEVAAEELADALGRLPADELQWIAFAREVLSRHYDSLSAKRLAQAAAELAELVGLVDHLRFELPALELPAAPLPHDLPADPFCAGIASVLDRHNPVAFPDPKTGAYTAVAEEIAELLRDGEPDSVHCQAVAWVMVRQWATSEETGPIEGYAAIGGELATHVDMYRELASRYPSLVAPFTRDGASFLTDEPFALEVHRVLVEHDPFDLIADDASTADYVPYARELALRLGGGSPSPGWCQVLVWKVLTDPWGGLGGSIGRFRDLGFDLHAVATRL